MEALDSNSRWLYRRLKSEEPKMEPLFSFQGTAHWMRGLALLVEDSGFSSAELSLKYQRVRRRASPATEADTRVFEFIFMSFQNLSGLGAMCESGYPSDFVRSAIVAWYYGLYYSASAMLAAADGSVQEEHRGTANAWDRQVVQNKLIPYPFDIRVPTLVKKDYEAEIKRLRGSNPSALVHEPMDRDQAFGACLSYLKGTAEYERGRAEERIKTHKNFKSLGVTDFRTKAARSVRDVYLRDKTTGFLHQAFRYRGKANYRDALYLGYGTEYTTSLERLLCDLRTVLSAFAKASAHFCARRVEKGTWDTFIQDLEANSRLKLAADVLKV